MTKSGKIISFMATPTEQKIIEEVRKKNFKLNQSDAIRLLINEGFESAKQKAKAMQRPNL